MELTDKESLVLDKYVRQLLDLTLRSDITREKYLEIVKNVFSFGYSAGYGDGCLDGHDDAVADEHGDLGHIDNARYRF